jgi:uncharacterized protein YdaU (DUF1376 family)
MADQPWFKFFAADYLLDPDVDNLPREAEGLLIRMWCICHREGSCPADVETLARKTLCSQEYVSQFRPQCEPFFELRDGKLYSRRMEEEKHRSQQASLNANKRYQKKTAVQSAVPIALPRSDSDFDSGFRSGSGSVFVLEENARAREARGVPACNVCGDQKLVHVGPEVPGKRIVPCPECCGSKKRAASA